MITAPMPDYPPITEVSFSSSDPRGRLAAWTIEREAIRQRKEAGQAWPWTDEPILAVGRFCNVYREHDRVTRWITANIVEPHRDDPDLWFALTLARCINEPDALAELLPFLLLFDAKAVAKPCKRARPAARKSSAPTPISRRRRRPKARARRCS